MAKNPTLTTESGMPVGDNQTSITAAPRGPVLMQDFHLLEKLAHQNREPIPERVVRAKGWSAHGTCTARSPSLTSSANPRTPTCFPGVGKKTDLLMASR